MTRKYKDRPAIDNVAHLDHSRTHSFVWRDGARVCSSCGVTREVSDADGVQFFKLVDGKRKRVELPRCNPRITK